jgi:phosphoserine phosphatase
MTPSYFSAKDKARADLPEAVGPATSMAFPSFPLWAWEKVRQLDGSIPAVMTLIANPSVPVLTPTLVATIHAQLPHADNPDVLDPGIAVDLPFFVTSPQEMQHIFSACRDLAAPYPIDLVAQPQQYRKKRLLIADCDSTMIVNESLDILAERAGHREQVSILTQKAMNNLIDFETALRLRLGLLAGLPVSWIEDALENTIILTPGAATLVQTMRAHGAYTCLASSGLTLFIEPVAQRLGFDRYVANRVKVEDGLMTHHVEGPIVTGRVKAETLQALCQEYDIPREETLAVGDGGNDCEMLSTSGLGVAFRTQRACVLESANTVIAHSDMTALLYAQGFRRSAFVLR